MLTEAIVTGFAAVLMDLDQTIIDSRESIMRSFERAFETELGRRLDRAQVERIWGFPLERQMAMLAGEEVAGRLVDAYRAYLLTQDHLIRVFPGWPMVLATLRQRGYRLAVVTSKKRYMAQRHLEVVGLAAAIDAMVAADDSSAHKPDPEPFLLAARELDVAPEACLAVGDSPWDIIGAKRAGMVAAVAEWDESRPSLAGASADGEGAVPDIRVGRPEDLLLHCPPLSGSGECSTT